MLVPLHGEGPPARRDVVEARTQDDVCPQAQNDVRCVRLRVGPDELAILALPNRPTIEDSSLTPAERDVVTAVLAGRSNPQIAAARGTAPRTVANQIAGVFRKLGVSSRRELIALAGRR